MKDSYRRLTEDLTDTEADSLFEAVVEETAKQDETVATQLVSVYADEESSGSERFFDDLHLVLITFDHVDRLACQLQREANDRPDWARVFLGNAPLITDSVVT